MVKVNWIKEVEKIKVNNLETLCLTINDGKSLSRMVAILVLVA